MPALNFQKQFAPDVEAGRKTNSIRAPRKDGRAHCKVGDRLKLYTGMRTKGCRLLGEGLVRAVSEIEINVGHVRLVSGPQTVDMFGRVALDSFAREDGFENWPAMAGWFAQTHGLPFHGFLIRWTFCRWKVGDVVKGNAHVWAGAVASVDVVDGDWQVTVAASAPGLAGARHTYLAAWLSENQAEERR